MVEVSVVTLRTLMAFWQSHTFFGGLGSSIFNLVACLFYLFFPEACPLHLLSAMYYLVDDIK